MRAVNTNALPKNDSALRLLVVELQGQLRERDQALQVRATELHAGQQELVYLRSWIEKLKLELARLRRMQFGRSVPAIANLRSRGRRPGAFDPR